MKLAAMKELAHDVYNLAVSDTLVHSFLHSHNFLQTADDADSSLLSTVPPNGRCIAHLLA